MSSGTDFYSGVSLCSRYSRVPNSLGYCGPQNISNDFLKCIIGNDCSSAESALKKFEGLYPYLRFIAGKHGKDPFDPDVVEAYWLGNDLIEGFSRKEFSGHLDSLVKCGLPKSISENLKMILPETPMPMHLFNVIFVGVGNISGSVRPILENMDKCRVSWGKVIKVNAGSLSVKYMPLVREGNHFVLGKEAEKQVKYEKLLLPKLNKGDVVSIHWEEACEALSGERTEQLQHYTEKVLSLLD